MGLFSQSWDPPEVSLTNCKVIALNRSWSLTDLCIAGGHPDGLQGQGKGVLCEKCVQRKAEEGRLRCCKKSWPPGVCQARGRGHLEQACPGVVLGGCMCMCIHTCWAPPQGISHGRRFSAVFVLLVPYDTLLTGQKEQEGCVPHRCLREGKQLCCINA